MSFSAAVAVGGAGAGAGEAAAVPTGLGGCGGGELDRATLRSIAMAFGVSVASLRERHRLRLVGGRRGDGAAGQAVGAAGAAGGDQAASGYVHAGDNARVVLTCADGDGKHREGGWMQGPPGREKRVGVCRPTSDRNDRAHLVRLGGGSMLLPARDLEPSATRPRLYHEHQFTSRGGTYEQACDELHERERYLEREGLGRLRGVAGQGSYSAPTPADVIGGLSGDGRWLRGVIDRNDCAWRPRGDEDAAGSAWLAEHGYSATGRRRAGGGGGGGGGAPRAAASHVAPSAEETRGWWA